MSSRYHWMNQSHNELWNNLEAPLDAQLINQPYLKVYGQVWIRIRNSTDTLWNHLRDQLLEEFSNDN